MNRGERSTWVSGQDGQDGTDCNQDELKLIIVMRTCTNDARPVTYVDQFGDDDGQVMESDNCSLVNRGEHDGSLLADEELDVGDDLGQDDGDVRNDRSDLGGGGQISGAESLC